MKKDLSRRLISKWLFLFVISVLVLPELVSDAAGPSNENSCNLRKRRIVGYCKKCNYRAETEVAFLKMISNVGNAYLELCSLTVLIEPDMVKYSKNTISN